MESDVQSVQSKVLEVDNERRKMELQSGGFRSLLAEV